jgi:dimethylaniline monooxygenase (N-oxide forming)
MRVGIIGAGPAGLATLKELSAAGFDAIAFEARPRLGGLFVFDEDDGLVWDSLRLTSSTLVTQFSDFPAPANASLHMTHHEYVRYLESYATHFDLWPHLRFSSAIDTVEPDGASWSMRARGHPELRFDAIVVCTGVHRRPFTPEIPGLDRFTGSIHHAARYRRPDAFRGRRVVCVGAGESGGEVIALVAQVARSCSVSLRRGAYFLPRLVDGMPGDYLTTRIVHGFGSAAVPALRQLGVAKAAFMRGAHPKIPPEDHFEAAVQPTVRSLFEKTGLSEKQQFSTKTDALPIAIANGACTVRPGIESVEGSAVRYVDGTTDEADAILFCTGFDVPGWPFLGRRAPKGSLYHRIIDPMLGSRIAFVGFVRPAIGSIPPITEMQARWVATVFAGDVELPDPHEMQKRIDDDDAWTREMFPKDCDQLPYIVAQARYLDGLAVEIGCMPSLKDISKPRELIWKFFAAPFTTLQYRIAGPGSLADAKDRMLELPVHPKNLRGSS